MWFAGNPLVMRQTRRQTWPPGYLALLGGLGMLLGSLLAARRGLLRFYMIVQALNSTRPAIRSTPLLTITQMIQVGQRHPDTGVLAMLVLVAAGLVLLLPLPVAFTASALVSRDLASGPLQLLRLTHVTPAGLLQGYVLAVLYRLRLPLTLLAGALPALAAGLMNLWIVGVSRWIVDTGTLYRVDFAGWMIPDVNQTHLMLAFAAVAFGLFGLTLMAAMLGVGLTLLLRRALPALALTLALTGAYLVVLSLALADRVLSPVISPQYAIPIAAMIFPYALGAAALWLAHRFSFGQS